jgi:predicted O-methyltransferase YrrM
MSYSAPTRKAQNKPSDLWGRLRSVRSSSATLSSHKPLTSQIQWKFVEMMATILPYQILRNKIYFDIWERHGVYILPRHFYEPIPDSRALLASAHKSPSSSLKGIQLNDEEQLRLLEEFAYRFGREYETFPEDSTVPHQFRLKNSAFTGADAVILYCMVRSFKPKRIIEIGSGNSTYLSAQAILQNSQDDPQYEGDLMAIEPYPNSVLKAGFSGLTSLVQTPVQEVSLDFFQQLESGDILFVDSSHVLTTRGDVQYIYLEILPNLRPGVIVHCHDIFFPRDYPRTWLIEKHRFWNEQYLLQAFLVYNNQFQVLWAGNYMHYNYPSRLQALIPAYNADSKIGPASFWMRRVLG